MFYTKKKHKVLKVLSILIFSGLIGGFIGYQSVRNEDFPFYEKINQNTENKELYEKQFYPEDSQEGIYTSLSENNKIDKGTSEPSPAPPSKPTYTVKTENSKVYLFKTDESGNVLEKQPLPINLNSLLEEDKKLLAEGIKISKKEELASVLEDFGS